MNAVSRAYSLLRSIVHVDTDELDVVEALAATIALLILLLLRLLIGPMVFTSGVAVFVTMLFARNARHLWKVFIFVAIYGTLVTVVAQQVASHELLALVFIWLVTFISGLAILMPVTNVVIGLINVWAVIAMTVTPTSDSPRESAISWLLGTGVAIGVIWYARRRRYVSSDQTVDFTRASFQIDATIRRHVAIFALGRATAVAIGGAVGLIFFPAFPWLPAMAALVVIGINPEKSRLIAVQRSLGTLLGVLIAMYVASNADSLWALLPVLIVAIFVTMLVQNASPLLLAAGLTVTLLLSAGLRSDTPLKLAAGRMIETLIGVGIGLVTIHYLQPYLTPIMAFVQERSKDLEEARRERGQRRAERRAQRTS